MADRHGRRKQPFRFWFPSWSSPSRASQQPKPQPPSRASQSPAFQPSPQSSQAPKTTEPQLDDDGTAAREQTPSPSRKSLLPPPSPTPAQAMQAEPPRPQGDSQELADDLVNQVGKHETQLTLEEEKPSKPSKLIDVDTLENLITKTSPSEPLEDKTKAELESKQVETIAQFTEEIRPGKLDIEAEHEQDKSPTKIAATKKKTEEFYSEGVEAPTEKHNNQVSEEPIKLTKPKLSIIVSDSIPTSYHQRNQELKSPDRITEPEEPANGAFKESKRQSSTLKERKITISTMPRAGSPNLERPSMQKDLKDGLSRLVKKLSIGHQNKLGNEQGVNIITLASENMGASMFIGYDGMRGEIPNHIHRGQKVGKSTAKGEEIYHNVEGNPSILASINSNVQGINSSILDETNYRERNPGVHVIISTKPTEPVSITGKTESPKTQKATSSTASPQKLTYEPNVRRRCLRALFLESSDDDIKDPQKPRRHGCRFTCDGKKKEGEDTVTSRK